MKKYSYKIIYLSLMLSTFLIGACSFPKVTSYVKDYHQAISRFDASPANKEHIDSFAELYGDLKHEETLNRVNNLYADDIYFNDTFNTFTTREELLNYIKHTQELIEESSIEVTDMANNGNDYYVRWVMRLRATAKGKMIDSESIGITHLRFNEENKIVLHQDYWDAVEAFYQHLPYVGGVFRSIREDL